MTQTYFSKLTLLFFALLLFSSCGEDEEPTVDETTFLVSISGDSNASEDSNTGFKISLDNQNDSGNDITISYSVGGTATAGTDYQTLSLSSSIADGESEVSVPVILIDDSEVEDDETIVITLSSDLPTGVSLGTSSLTMTIADNDEQGGTTCSNDNSISTDDNGCSDTPSVANEYSDATINSNNLREIITNGVPNHDYSNQLADKGVTLSTSSKTYFVSASPAKANAITSVTTDSNRPEYRFGIAKNGVPMDPAPAEPFIFENSSTGEYNWDWVFEPTNNTQDVNLDCAYAHVQPDGTYHYHGDMVEYANTLLDGLGDATVTPSEAVQVGWAADGYPVFYKYGPTASGNGAEKLSSGYILKSGDRPGDGVTEPCGEYNGKYTNDYEWSANAGDLDECNGIDRSVTIGSKTYNYFYVITDAFPVIPRCLSGTPDDSFKLGPN